MKYIYRLLCLFFGLNSYGQTLYTFQNTTSTPIASGASATLNISVSGVPTTGMVLRQVNIGFGVVGSTNSGNVNAITMRLKDVTGTLSTMLSPSSFDGATGDYQLFDIHLRDNSVLRTPKSQKDATSSVLGKGYPFHYGYYKPEGSFSVFNTTGSVNGTWQFVLNNAAAGSRTFTKIELVFGPAIVGADIRSSKGNQSCATRQCIDGSRVYYATNSTYPTGQTVTPGNTVGTCGWNGQKDNNAWFSFIASGSSAYVSVSGFSSVQESSVFTVSSCAAAATYNIVSGGCGPTSMYNGSTVHAQKYYNGSYAGGYAWNHGYYLTGLSAGSEYVLVVDGSSASISDFYVEITSGGSTCAAVLPIELLYFEGKAGDINNITWETATEENNAYFELEKSQDGVSFKSLAKISSQSLRGNSEKPLKYNYSDVACDAYYRLKQVDHNGELKYYNTIYIENNKTSDYAMVHPNPAKDKLTISYNAKTITRVNVSLLDVSGREVKNETLMFDHENREASLNIETLQNGLYFIRIENGYSVILQKMIKE